MLSTYTAIDLVSYRTDAFARNMSGKATFENTRFAQGRFRNAYMGMWTEPPEKAGKQCVVKERKDSYTWKSTDWDTAVKINKKAQELAAGFNSFASPNRRLSYTDVDVYRVTYTPDPTSRPKLDEYVIVEEYLPGEFKKWCNNYGYISSEAEHSAICMPAFMHWSWVHTNGELMIADLQGVRKDDRYDLTDPVIMSLDSSYGATDTGVEGMVMFFFHHKCNTICQKLPLPKIADFTGEIPNEKMVECMQILRRVQGSTTYSGELHFTAEIRTKVTQTFRLIAQQPRH